MTLPASKQNIDVQQSNEPTERRAEPQGWDPFEVWRTRILLPRLAEAAAAEQEKLDVSPMQLVRR
jgi:hypothetical protein